MKLQPRMPFPLYLDESRQVRAALQLPRPTLLQWLTNLRGWLRYLRAFSRIRRQGRITGHHSDLPAVAILGPGGAVEFLHKGRTMADYPQVATVLGQLRAGNS